MLAHGSRAAHFAALYVVLCLVLSVLAFVPQETSEVFYLVLFIVMVPISLMAFFITYIGGVISFGPGDWPTWARVAEVVLWTLLAAVQAFGLLVLWRTRGDERQ
jgi:hypothetical protein